MAAPSKGGGEPIEDRRQLVEYFERACKPVADWRIGTEHEKFMFNRRDLSPLTFAGERGVGDFLSRLTDYGWTPVQEAGQTVALQMNGCGITLEPGGQLELAGEPLETIHDACAEVHEHLRQVKAVGEDLDVGLIGLGFAPTWRRDEVPWMPKQRYEVMGRYMPKVGNLGLDMMLRTATIQVNYDFADEADMVKKMRVGLALQPLATALFANSPFTEGAPNGYLSYRSQIWLDTDDDRCGMLPWVFEDGMGFERYTDYALDVPMYFVYRDGKYIDAAGQSFRDFLDGKLPALPGECPTMTDWDDHLTTIFPEVRMKRFLEMRGADSGPWARICALPALWTGILYDAVSLDDAWALVRDWSREERDALRRKVPRTALDTPFRNTTVGELASEMLALARQGLRRRARLDSQGRDESHFLDRLEEIAESGHTPADELLAKHHNDWDGRMAPLFKEYAY